jgi:CBS domain-containing protein
MDIELIESQGFLASHPRFDRLPEEALQRLPRRLTVRYFRRGVAFPPEDADQPCIYILHRGPVELRNAGGDLISKLAQGGIYFSRCRPDDPEGRLAASTAEHTLAYLLPCPELDLLWTHHPAFADHFERSSAERLRTALDVITEGPTAGASLMTVRISDLIGRNLIVASLDTPIREAARIMTEHRASSLELATVLADLLRELRGKVLIAHHARGEVW